MSAKLREVQNDLIDSNREIAKTGSSGTDNIHLDITTFYVPKMNARRIDPLPRTAALAGDTVPPTENYDVFYRIGLTPLYESVIVDPLEIWAGLAEDTTCQGG